MEGGGGTDVYEGDEDVEDAGGADGVEGQAGAGVDAGDVAGVGDAVFAREGPEHARGGGEDGDDGEDVYGEDDGCLWEG